MVNSNQDLPNESVEKSPWRVLTDDGYDVEALRDNLVLTPLQRMQRHEAARELFVALHGKASKAVPGL